PLYDGDALPTDDPSQRDQPEDHRTRSVNVTAPLAELSPVVQALPPSAALVELKGALRYHGVDARRLGEVLRVRTISRLGVDVRVGIGSSITVAATASGQIVTVRPASSPWSPPPTPSSPNNAWPQKLAHRPHSLPDPPGDRDAAVGWAWVREWGSGWGLPKPRVVGTWRR
ncbi:hypothetical protein ACH4PR_55275, partial [Streptomyces mirabilis]